MRFQGVRALPLFAPSGAFPRLLTPDAVTIMGCLSVIGRFLRDSEGDSLKDTALPGLEKEVGGGHDFDIIEGACCESSETLIRRASGCSPGRHIQSLLLNRSSLFSLLSMNWRTD